MKQNKKLNAFTLAEVMILLLTLSILLAAFAPVFTKRKAIQSSEGVWSFVSGDNGNNAYFDSPDKTLTASAFIGVLPPAQVNSAINNHFAKIIIASEEVQPRTNNQLNQIQFRYNNEPVGALFADGTNMTIGGTYTQRINTGRAYNTSFGINSLSNNILGSSNTAVGHNALTSNDLFHYTTAIGYSSLPMTRYRWSNMDTLIGYNIISNSARGQSTLIGNNIATKGSAQTGRNTLIGNNIGNSNAMFTKDTIIGYQSGRNLTESTGNTIVGANSLNSLTKGSYNTIVGYGAGNLITAEGSSYKTCIGAHSCSGRPPIHGESGFQYGYDGLFSGEHERVFIGSAPYSNATNATNATYPGAVLEVHNIGGKITDGQPIATVGNPTVIVNGNLIVRGQTYLEQVMYRQYNIDNPYYRDFETDNDNVKDNPDKFPKGLVLRSVMNHRRYPEYKFFAGFDGMKRDYASYELAYDDDYNGKFYSKTKLHGAGDKTRVGGSWLFGGEYIDPYKDIRYNCTCATNAIHTSYKYPLPKLVKNNFPINKKDSLDEFHKEMTNKNSVDFNPYPSQSYDWVSSYGKISGGSNHYQGTEANRGNPRKDKDIWNSNSYSNAGYGLTRNGFTFNKFQPIDHTKDMQGRDLYVMHGMYSESPIYIAKGTEYTSTGVFKKGGLLCQHNDRVDHKYAYYESNSNASVSSCEKRIFPPTWYNDRTRPYYYRRVLVQRNHGKGPQMWGITTNKNPNNNYTDWSSFGTDVNWAHFRGRASCCPNLTELKERSELPSDYNIPASELPSESYLYRGMSTNRPKEDIKEPGYLTSDARLKNISQQFKGGLAEIKKLNFYHFTFKADELKLPHVGVIAQDLKLVFPNAVSKDQNGFYKIRWDELFFAAINAVKELNSNVNSLVTKINDYNKRVSKLKNDNKLLNAQLDKLADDIAKLKQ